MLQGSVNSAVLDHREALHEVNSTKAANVTVELHRNPPGNPALGTIGARVTGHVTHGYCLLQLKRADHPKSARDNYHFARRARGDVAFRPMQNGNCSPAAKL